MIQAYRPEIAVIDDDALTLEFLTRQVRSLDCTLLTFVHQCECMAYLESTTPAVLVADAYMSPLTGIEFLLNFHALRRYQVSNQPSRLFLYSSIKPTQDVAAQLAVLGAEFAAKDKFLDRAWLSQLVATLH